MLFKVTAALFLLPLVIYAWAASPRRDGRRAAALLSAAVAAVVVLFLVIEPRIVQVTWSQFATATSGSRLVEGIASSGLRTFNRNLRDTLTAGLAGLGIINALALIVWAVADRRTPTSLGWRVPALWIGPWLTFLLLVHIGRPGYVLPLLAPAALILGSFYARQRPAVAAALVVAQALVNVAHFTSVHPFSDATTGGTLTYRDKTIVQRAASDLQPLTLPTAFTIAQSDAVVDRLEHVAAEQCPDGKLVIVAGSEPVDWRRVMWYLPAATSIYVVDRVPIYVAQHTDFSPVPQGRSGSGVTLSDALARTRRCQRRCSGRRVRVRDRGGPRPDISARRNRSSFILRHQNNPLGEVLSWISCGAFRLPAQTEIDDALKHRVV